MVRAAAACLMSESLELLAVVVQAKVSDESFAHDMAKRVF
jgi:hypothetical protein